MSVQPYTEAKKAANKRWNEKNKERTRYISTRSAARSFIKNRATEEDLHELSALIQARLGEKG